MKTRVGALLVGIVWLASFASAQEATLEAVLKRAGAYVVEFQRSLSGVVAEEQYVQSVRYPIGTGRSVNQLLPTHRELKSDLLLVKPAGVDHIVLVTHWLHMPRALRAFREAAGSAMRIEAAPMSLAGDTELSALSWVPSNTGFVQMRYALREWLGRLAGA